MLETKQAYIKAPLELGRLFGKAGKDGLKNTKIRRENSD